MNHVHTVKTATKAYILSFVDFISSNIVTYICNIRCMCDYRYYIISTVLYTYLYHFLVISCLPALLIILYRGNLSFYVYFAGFTLSISIINLLFLISSNSLNKRSILYKLLFMVCLLGIIVSILYYSHINYINETLQDWFNVLITGGPGPGENLTGAGHSGGGYSGGGPSGGGPPGGGPSGGEALAGDQSHAQQRDNPHWWMDELYKRSDKNPVLFLDNSGAVPDQGAEARDPDFGDKDLESIKLRQMVYENNRKSTQLHHMKLNGQENSERYINIKNDMNHSREMRYDLIRQISKRTKFFKKLSSIDNTKKDNYEGQ